MTLESELQALKEQRERETAREAAEQIAIDNEIRERIAFLEGKAWKEMQPRMQLVRETGCLDTLNSLVQLERLTGESGQDFTPKTQAQADIDLEVVFREKRNGSGGVWFKYDINSGELVLKYTRTKLGYSSHRTRSDHFTLSRAELELLRGINTRGESSFVISLRWNGWSDGDVTSREGDPQGSGGSEIKIEIPAHRQFFQVSGAHLNSYVDADMQRRFNVQVRPEKDAIDKAIAEAYICAS